MLFWKRLQRSRSSSSSSKFTPRLHGAQRGIGKEEIWFCRDRWNSFHFVSGLGSVSVSEPHTKFRRRLICIICILKLFLIRFRAPRLVYWFGFVTIFLGFGLGCSLGIPEHVECVAALINNSNWGFITYKRPEAHGLDKYKWERELLDGGPWIIAHISLSRFSQREELGAEMFAFVNDVCQKDLWMNLMCLA